MYLTSSSTTGSSPGDRRGVPCSNHKVSGLDPNALLVVKGEESALYRRAALANYLWDLGDFWSKVLNTVGVVCTLSYHQVSGLDPNTLW